MSLSKTDAFYLGNAWALDMLDVESVHELSDKLKNGSYPGSIRRRADELLQYVDLDDAIREAHRIVLEVINEHE